MNLLYLSNTGLLETLGQTQVLNYLKLLYRDYGHNLSLITFEKPDDLVNKKKLRQLKQE